MLSHLNNRYVSLPRAYSSIVFLVPAQMMGQVSFRMLAPPARNVIQPWNISLTINASINEEERCLNFSFEEEQIPLLMNLASRQAGHVFVPDACIGWNVRREQDSLFITSHPNRFLSGLMNKVAIREIGSQQMIWCAYQFLITW